MRYCDECANRLPAEEKMPQDDPKYWRCRAFPIQKESHPERFLSKSLDPEYQPVEYYFCSIARAAEALCSPEGKKFKALPQLDKSGDP
jgi:hypothetical protein